LSVGIQDIHERATLSVAETAELLGLGRGSAYEAARRGDIPTLRVGRRLLVPVPALLRLLGGSVPDPAEASPGAVVTAGRRRAINGV